MGHGYVDPWALVENNGRNICTKSGLGTGLRSARTTKIDKQAANRSAHICEYDDQITA